MLPFRKILCPTDFSEPSRQAIEAAKEMAAHFGSELLMLHVVTPTPAAVGGIEPVVVTTMNEQELEASARKSLAEMAQRFQAQGLNARFLVLFGNAADEIIQIADRENVELVVIATRGRTGLDRLIFGSVAEKVVRLAKCPVMTVGGRTPGGTGIEAKPEKAEEGEKPEEKTEERKAREERIEAQLKDWGARIDEIRARAERAKAELIMRYEEQIGALRAKEEAVREKMLEFKNAGEGVWDDFKSDMEKSLDSLRNDLERALSKVKDTISDADEKIARKKAAYGQKVEDRLRKWGVMIDTLKAKAESSRTEAKTVYLNQIEELRRKQEAARKRLQDFKESGNKAWGDLKGSLDQVLEDLKKSIKQAASRFKGKQRE